jgi:hypothetical protein
VSVGWHAGRDHVKPLASFTSTRLSQVLVIATPICIGPALRGLSSHSITPAAVAGCLVIGAAFGRPGSVMRQSGRVVRSRVGYDYVLLATGTVHVGVVAGVIDYVNH